MVLLPQHNFRYNRACQAVLGPIGDAIILRGDIYGRLKEIIDRHHCDAVTFLSKKVAFGESAPVKDCFIYCDPPYLGTGDNYSDSYTEDMSAELFDCLVSIGCNFSLSEFDHPFILEQAKKHGLNIIYVGERTNLKNKRTEVLITNYEDRQKSLFA